MGTAISRRTRASSGPRSARCSGGGVDQGAATMLTYLPDFMISKDPERRRHRRRCQRPNRREKSELEKPAGTTVGRRRRKTSSLRELGGLTPARIPEYLARGNPPPPPCTHSCRAPNQPGTP